MLTVALPEARKLASGVVLGQASITAVVALLCYVAFGSLAAQSAAVGGGISTMATLVMVALAFRRAVSTNPQLAARAFFVGEAAKVTVMIVLFVLALKLLRVSAGALFAGFVATFFVYWLALANALPSFGATVGASALTRTGKSDV